MLSPAEGERLRVVLVATRNPLNIGAAARAMSNFGFGRLRVVKPFGPSFREARSAVGAADVLAQAEEFDSVAEAVADCVLVIGTTAGTRREPPLPLRSLEDGAKEIRKKLVRGPVAVLFGSEKRGLSNEDFSRCHWLMRIPASEKQPSMNLGQAVAVCLYDIARLGQRKRSKSAEPEAATARDVERTTAMLLEALERSGYTKSNTKRATEEKMRRLVRRMNLQAEDAVLWMGILRQILWKLRAEK